MGVGVVVSAEPSVGADQDKINGSDRECRRQQEIQSGPINNILVRRQLPPPQSPLPPRTPPPLPSPHPCRMGPLDYWPPGGGREAPAAQYCSHSGPSLTSCLHLLDIHLSACVRVCLGSRGLTGVMVQGGGACVWWSMFFTSFPTQSPFPLKHRSIFCTPHPSITRVMGLLV